MSFLKKLGSVNLRGGKIKDEDKLNFAQGLKLLINSGIPIQEALQTLVIQTGPGAYRDFLVWAQERVEGGSSLYSICKGNKNFDPVFLNFIKVGEETGNLSQSLDFLFEWLDNRQKLKKEISSVTLYPKILVVFAIIVGVGLTIFILPGIVGVIEGLNVEPFIATRILLAISSFAKEYGVYLVVGLAVLGVLFFFSLRIPLVKRIIDLLAVRLPVIGPLTRDYQLTVVSQVGFTLYSSGIPASQIFRIITEASSNYYYRQSMAQITESIEKGTSPSRAMRAFPHLYPASFVSVIGVGEKTGTLDNSFSYLAQFCQARLFRKTRLLPTIIEPALLLVIGLAIAFIALAIIVPIYDITRGIK